LPEVRSTVRLSRTLPSQVLAEGFLLPNARLIRQTSGAKPERETRIPGLARTGAWPKRGACRRKGGDEPDTDGRANFSEFANCGAFVSAAIDYICNFGLPHVAAQPTPMR
jgi:hypothetical protein